MVGRVKIMVLAGYPLALVRYYKKEIIALEELANFQARLEGLEKVKGSRIEMSIVSKPQSIRDEIKCFGDKGPNMTSQLNKETQS